MIKTRLKAPKGKKGEIEFEAYSENKRRNPSPEEKRHDVGEKDFTHKKVIKGKDGGIKHKKKFTKRGNTQILSSRTNRKVNGKNEKGRSSFSSDVKIVESGPKRKYKVKSSNTPEEIKSGVGVPDSEHWDSERHLVSSKLESKSNRTKYSSDKAKKHFEDKDKRSKFKGKKGIAKLRKVKSDQPSYKKLYGDMLG
tara:strand:- start:504 stop:1088 length:585 start_codon:yes stop_codon:yes gene_type:complete